MLAGSCLLFGQSCAAQQDLPESPGYLMLGAGSLDGRALEPGPDPQTTSPTLKPHCTPKSKTVPPGVGGSTAAQNEAQQPCEENPVQSVVTKPVHPLTPSGKADLAWRDFTDPFNFITIAGYSGISVAANAHSAFGPGFAGWGRLTGYSLVEDAQGEFTGTFLLPSLFHQDPRYHRMPGAPLHRRILHAVAHTYVTQHDDGRRMINYSTLINYPLSAEIANLYVPGIQDNMPDTVRRFSLGIASDPAGTLVAEFLPDVAQHIHVHVIFIQEIMNRVITGANAPNVQ